MDDNKALPSPPENEFVPPQHMPPPPTYAAPPPPPPANVFVGGERQEEVPAVADASSDEECDVEQHGGAASPSDDALSDIAFVAGAQDAAEVQHEKIEGVVLPETSLGPVLEADGIEELPMCVRGAQAAVSGSAFQLHTLQQEAAAARRARN
mmetsp:Transcript_17356/g.67476  ORF Transcript_17356/g.67476 Transcript_17356/m.67476 type:complete len:152 (+) Transcript_17356:132-587(+)